MRRALLFVSCSCLAIAQSAAPSDWRFAQPDSDIKVSVNFQALLKSAAIAKAIEQAKTQNQSSAAQIDLVMGMLRTVDRVSVSGVQKAPNDMDVLAEVSGSFDPQIVTNFFPSTGKSKVKVIGPHTVLIGEGDSFTAALARLNGSAPSAPVDDLAASDVWIEANAGFIAKQSGQQTSPMLKDLRGLAVGLTLSDAPVFDVVLNAASDAGAATMLQTFQAMTPLLATQPSSAALAKNLSLRQDGSRVRMHLVIPPEVVAMIQQQAASAANSGGVPTQLTPLLSTLGLGGASAIAPAAPAASATKAPPAQNGGTIRIYGLDDGPKEVPAGR